MKTKILLAAATAGVMFAGSVLASTLDDVRASTQSAFWMT
jgi:hypothetical protein